MNKTYQQEFQEKLDQGYTYSLWIGLNYWQLSKMHASSLYLLRNSNISATFERPSEAVFYLLLEEGKIYASRWEK